MSNFDIFSESDHYLMPYYVSEVDFHADGSFQKIEKETWQFGVDRIITPHGNLGINGLIFVTEGPLVGVQFSVRGRLKMNEFSCSDGDENAIFIGTLALVRQPHNAWLWVYAFDKNGCPLVNFCGFEDLDGMVRYMDVLQKLYR